MVYTSASVIVGCLDRVDSSADTRSASRRQPGVHRGGV